MAGGRWEEWLGTARFGQHGAMGATALLVHRVSGLELGDVTGWHQGRLVVCAGEAEALVASPALAEVRIRTCAPGQPARIVKVLDSVEPRTKAPGGGGIFPGQLVPAHLRRAGPTHVLRGAAVVAAGHLPRAQEAVVDMSGPASCLSPVGATHNLVVEFTPAPDAAWDQVDAALRRGVLALAARLADAALGSDPDETEVLPSAGQRAGRDLPRVATVTNLQTQGAFKDTFVYGRSFNGCLPSLIDPGELDDGAVVSGQFGHPGLKNPTFVHQNHPVVAALRARHGQDLDFAGVVLSPEPVDQAGKELVSGHTARLCALAGFDAVVVTKEGGGNADADMSLAMDALEDLGIAAVGLFAEMAGRDGTGPSVVVPPVRATAMVSTGNYDERVSLPAMARALGGDRVELVDRAATDAFELPMAAVYGSLNPLGWGRTTCWEGP